MLRLSAFQRLEDLTREADALWPADPEKVPAYERWLVRARELVAGLEPHGDDRGHRAQLAALRERAVVLGDEEREVAGRAHPRFAELERLRKKLAALRRARDVRAGTVEPETFALDASALPADAGRLNALAWPLVDPERVEFGRETEGLALARLAIEKVEDDEEAATAGNTLAWALLANGLDDESLSEGAAALAVAPADRSQAFERTFSELKAAVEATGTDAALTALEVELSTLEAEVSSAPVYRFADEQDTWWHNQLEKLVGAIEAFADPRTGLVEGLSSEQGWGIERRRVFAATIAERSVGGAEPARLWAEAVASIGDPKECPPYGGLWVTPQLGLLPLGRDPDSGLWEFAHLLSGEPARRGADGKLVLSDATGIVLVLLPGGTFWMGAQKSDPSKRSYDPAAQSDEAPVHEVRLSPFFLSKYELTQGQWERLTGRNPSQYGPERHERSWNAAGKPWSGLHPVEQVSWDDCMETLGRLGLALPSEAQWEYGARAGTKTVWWSGDEQESLKGAANLSDAYGRSHGGENWSVWEPWLDDGQSIHAEVGTHRANPFGLHDVHGNVWEWCRDGYDSGFYATSSRIDPVAPWKGSSYRVYRGGSFVDAAVSARSAKRGPNALEFANGGLGVRPARALLAP